MRHLIHKNIYVWAAFIVAIAAFTGARAIINGDEHLVVHRYSDEQLRELVDSSSNYIIDSLQTLKPVVDKLRALQSEQPQRVSILHLGDSHIQAGYIDARLRWLFQSNFGNAGRGVVSPLKLLGTNAPSDYTITSPNRWIGYKCTDGHQYLLGPTAMAIESEQPQIEFKLCSQDAFSVVRVFQSATSPALIGHEELSLGSNCTSDDTPTSTTIILKESVRELTLRGEVSEQYPSPVYYGFSLENGNSGVLYHAVGVNGASFSSYNNHRSIIESMSTLSPDLVIVSLGTNDSYGKTFNSDYIYTQIDEFVVQLRNLKPEPVILLVTPMEYCNRTRRGFVPNANVGHIANIIKQYAASKGIACWDMYSAAGGKGANERWNKRDLVGRDHVHFSIEGYTLQGDMLYDAFMRYYNR